MITVMWINIILVFGFTTKRTLILMKTKKNITDYHIAMTIIMICVAVIKARKNFYKCTSDKQLCQENVYMKQLLSLIRNTKIKDKYAFKSKFDSNLLSKCIGPFMNLFYILLEMVLKIGAINKI